MQKVRRAGVALAVLVAMLVLSFASFSVSAEPEEDPLDGKSILFVGDSICEAMCEWSGQRWPYGKDIVGWAGRVIYGHNMTGKNLGKSGASVSDCRGANTVIAQLVQSQNTVYDYVIMHGGANDAWDSAPVGEMIESFDGPYDLTTFAGGLENMFKYAKETFPNAQLGFIINFQLPKGTYGRLSDMSEYMDTAVRICEKWEIPYLDLYHDEAFNEELKVTTNTYLHDYIHPNGPGYDVIAPHVDAWLQTVASCTYVYPGQETSAEESSSEEETSEEMSPASSAEEETVAEEADGSESEASGSRTATIVIIAVACVIAVAIVTAAIVVIADTKRSRKSK